MQRIQFDYFHGIEAEQYSFYRVPKVLFTADYFKALTCEAKVLYGLMLDRMSLSVRNRWFDEEDRVYIIFTIEEIMELLCCRTQKAVKLLKELDTENGIGLIEKRRPGLGRPNVIYVKNFMVEEADGLGKSVLQLESARQDSSPEDMQEVATGGQEAIGLQEEITISETAGFQNEKEGLEDVAVDRNTGNQKSRILKIKSQHLPESKDKDFENQNPGISAVGTPQFPESKLRSFENQNSVVLKTESQELPKSKPNNTDFNDTESSETEPIYSNLINPSGSLACPGGAVEEMDIYREIIRDRISYEHFTYDSRHLREEVDELVELVVDVMMMPDNSTLRIAGVERPIAVVKNRFMKLEQSHIEYVTGCLQKNTSKIENIKAYLLTTLYNATMTIDNYYRAEVNHDMYGSQSG
ncbi:MAG: replication initiator protein A [Lachnospiraceae bacterium]|nr:replication initiator protein A [Lachnospiraceae bacterium]MCI9191688.1 replication initiator protein A [Lachnospiraceae bacterium]